MLLPQSSVERVARVSAANMPSSQDTVKISVDITLTASCKTAIVTTFLSGEFAKFIVFAFAINKELKMLLIKVTEIDH